jgi:hypothetical protein
VAFFPDGGFIVAWANESFLRSVIHARLFARDGSPETGEFLLIEKAGLTQAVSRITTATDGSFLVFWGQQDVARGPYKGHFRRFDRHAAPLGPAIDAPTQAGIVALGPQGRFAVAWVEYATPDLYTNAMAQVFNADGSPLTAAFVIGSGHPRGEGDSLSAFPTGLVWGTGGALTAMIEQFDALHVDIQLTRFTFRGRVTSQVRLTSPPCCDANQGGGHLARNADGSLVVTWPEHGLLARRLAADGTPQSAPFLVAKRPASFQVYPLVVTLPTGGFVVVWTQEDGRDGDGWGIFGRAFAADGTPLSRDFLVNQTTAGDQFASGIAAGPNGQVVVVWDYQPDDGVSDVYARLLTP